MTTSLYERLGGPEKVAAMAKDIVDAHYRNPLIKAHFEKVTDRTKLVNHVRDFFGAGTGGKESYTGRDMPAAHKGMAVNERELMAAVDDVLMVLRQHGVGEPEQREVLAILYSLKDEVMFK
jgi:hemoglobin